MNRRNFVVGLGTVATISGVASVTSAAFGSSVNPETNFQVVPTNTELAVRRLQSEVDYNNLTNNATWNDSEITDFGNVTANQGSDVVAYVNSSQNGQLGAQLAFNNSNGTTYSDYRNTGSNGEWGFFEVANLGDTTESIGIEYNPDPDNIDESNSGGAVLDLEQLETLFTFYDDSSVRISPAPGGDGTPDNFAEIAPGGILVVELEIDIQSDIYGAIQDAAGGAFEETDNNIKLLESIDVGTQVN